MPRSDLDDGALDGHEHACGIDGGEARGACAALLLRLLLLLLRLLRLLLLLLLLLLLELMVLLHLLLLDWAREVGFYVAQAR